MGITSVTGSGAAFAALRSIVVDKGSCKGSLQGCSLGLEGLWSKRVLRGSSVHDMEPPKKVNTLTRGSTSRVCYREISGKLSLRHLCANVVFCDPSTARHMILGCAVSGFSASWFRCWGFARSSWIDKSGVAFLLLMLAIVANRRHLCCCCYCGCGTGYIKFCRQTFNAVLLVAKYQPDTECRDLLKWEPQ